MAAKRPARAAGHGGVRRAVRLALLALVVGGAAAAQEPEAARGLDPAALLTAPTIAPFSPPAFSPDGRTVAYVVRDNGRDLVVADTTSLRTGVAWFGLAADVWVSDVATGERRNLTGGRGSNWSPAWSPDGRRLAFLSDRDGAEPVGQSRLWLWDRTTDGLRLVADADVREGFHGLHWTGDGRGVVVTLFPLELPPAAYAASMKGNPGAPRAVGATVRVFEFEPGREQESPADQVNLDMWRRDVGVIDVETGRLRRLLTGRRVFAYSLSPDGRRIAYAVFAGSDRAVAGQYHFDLVTQEIATGDTAVIAAGVPLSLLALDGSFAWSPDGDAIAYRTGGPAAADEIHVANAAGGPSRRIADGPPSAEVGWSPARPVWGPAGRHVYFTRDGRLWRAAADGAGSVLFAQSPGRRLEIIAPRQQRLWSPDGRNAVLATHDPATKRAGFARVDLRSGTVRQVLEEDRRHGGYGAEPTISADAQSIAYVAESGTSPPDLWVATGDLRAPRRVSEVAPALTGAELGVARVIEWTAGDDTLRGALVLPAGYVAGRRYPLIVKVYGGSAISDDLNRFGFAAAPVENLQLLATRGYALLLADSRLGVGTPMADLYRTVMPGIDRVIELGVADPGRIGVTGHSYGGYSTLALIAQSSRFRAAVMRAGFGNLISSYGHLSDDGTNYGLAWAETGQGRMGGSPWEFRDRYIENSPFFLLDRIETPLLIVHGEDDDAVPFWLADEVFTGLRRLGRPVTYARYEGEGHWEGDWSLANRLDYLERVVAFFDRHLKRDAGADSVRPAARDGVTGAHRRDPTAGELIGFTDVTAVRLSPDGREVLLETRRADPDADAHEHGVWRAPAGTTAAGGGGARRVGAGLDPSSPAWVPGGDGGDAVSFLGTTESGPQLHVQAPGDAAARRITNQPGGVLSYAWSPDGRSVAFTTFAADPASPAEADAGRRGLVVSKWDFIFYRLFGNLDFADVERRVELRIRDPATGETERVPVEGSIEDFGWSPDGGRLAFTASPVAGLAPRRTDLFLYSRGDEAPELLLPGADGTGYGDAVGYSQPVWSPDGARVAVLREGGAGPSPELCVVAIGSRDVRAVIAADSLDLYRPLVTWALPDTLLLELTVRGRRGLFALALSDGRLTPVVYGNGEASGFGFAARGRRAAWVQQSADAPPEVHTGSWPFRDARRITMLNARLDSVWLPAAEPVHWTAADGADVAGWLLRPRGYEEGRRYPLITLVHGGPVFAVTDRFELYPAWPYPLQLLAARGYAVFLPNYRGTGSYGTAFLQPSADDAEPVDDVIAGVRHLVAAGIADSTRLGIMGQSHGAWIGPISVTRAPALFRAASFAEGMVDYISAYAWTPGWHNLASYEPAAGNPFTRTDRYVELSPMYRLGETRTPTLIEAGQQSLALQALQYATVLWRHAIPHELVIYPRTGHNIASPALALDSAERNLDWFDFWLLDAVDPDSAKHAQYHRWEEMRAGRGFPPPPTR